MRVVGVRISSPPDFEDVGLATGLVVVFLVLVSKILAIDGIASSHTRVVPSVCMGEDVLSILIISNYMT